MIHFISESVPTALVCNPLAKLSREQSWILASNYSDQEN